MRKFFYPLIAAASFAAIGLAACTANTDYNDYVSERRYAVFMYSGDDAEIKIYCCEKESPFVADGVRGQLNGLVEIYASFTDEYEKVNVTSESFTGGEMSYMTTRGCWYLSYSGDEISGSEITVNIEHDESSVSYTLLNVVGDGVMSCEQALDCVVEHAPELFEQRTVNGVFDGEIFIRLLYDEKCYYYVGVCSPDGTIYAYLVDGETGRIIAEREHHT